jgi:hypothetical protein
MQVEDTSLILETVEPKIVSDNEDTPCKGREECQAVNESDLACA